MISTMLQSIRQSFLKHVLNVGIGFIVSTASLGASHDPNTVQKWHKGWKYPQAGWLVVHIEGEPYERGLQHGHLLASEITTYMQTLANYWGPGAASQAWEYARKLSNLLFLRGFTPEQLEEMKGIAEGATAEGATFEKRPIDLIDIVTLNAANEIDTLDAALSVTATGIEGTKLSTKGSNRNATSAFMPRKGRPT
ncbi:MAG: hypothetical protein V4525_04750 [Pseudomonadota bacterium]